MNALLRLIRSLLLASVVLTLAACGGGGGDGGGGGGGGGGTPDPAITTQPQNATATVGAGATFTVVATGTGTLRYQWQRGGVDIAAATAASYALTALALADSGAVFTVRVANDLGSVTSSPATLTVTAGGLSIVTQPQSVTATVGQSAGFSVVASGATGITYQWRKNGSDIAGATSAALTLTTVALADSGARYSVHVVAGASAIDSSDAVLTVTALPEPAVATQVSAGKDHNLALRSDGAVLAWGSAGADQLSNGAILPGSVARVVPGIAAVSVAAGDGRSIAAGRDGRVYAWGTTINGEGTLGAGPPGVMRSAIPLALAGVTDAAAVLAITGQNLALTRAGTVRNWPGLLTYTLGGATTTVTPGLVPGLAGVVKIVRGGSLDTALALQADGGVSEMRWTLAQTIDTTTGLVTQTYTPTVRQLTNLSGIVDMSCAAHCLALKTDGRVLALAVADPGNANPVDVVPVEVPVLSNVKAVAMMGDGSIAVTRDGRVHTWGPSAPGLRFAGALSLPTELTALVGVASVSTGGAALFRLADGAVSAWGANNVGQLGTGNTLSRNFPRAVAGIDLLTSAVRITAQPQATRAAVGQTAHFSVTATGSGALRYDWMRNGVDIPGANAASYTTPALTLADDDVSFSVRVTDASGARTSRSVALIVTATPTSVNKPGRVVTDRVYSYTLDSGASASASWNWGDGGAAGVGSPALKVWRKPGTFNANGGSEAAFGVVAHGTPVAFGSHRCVVKGDNTLACWGSNSFGQLGDGAVVDKLLPTVVPGLSDVLSVSVTDVSSTCALKASGTVACWGHNDLGQLGDGSVADHRTPADIPGLQNVVALAGTCALRADGRVLCWGNNGSGQIGDGTSGAGNEKRLSPTFVAGLADAVSIAAGARSNCAIRATGTLVCWGRIDAFLGAAGFGQLTPTPVPGLNNVVSVRIAGFHVCALRSDQRVLCWGSNHDGQLGDGSSTDRVDPSLVIGLDDAVDIAVSEQKSCALKLDGSVACWGYYTQEAAEGTASLPAAHLQPLVISGIERASFLTSGVQTCAGTDDGRVRCWDVSYPVPLQGGSAYWK